MLMAVVGNKDETIERVVLKEILVPYGPCDIEEIFSHIAHLGKTIRDGDVQEALQNLALAGYVVWFIGESRKRYLRRSERTIKFAVVSWKLFEVYPSH